MKLLKMTKILSNLKNKNLDIYFCTSNFLIIVGIFGFSVFQCQLIIMWFINKETSYLLCLWVDNNLFILKIIS